MSGTDGGGAMPRTRRRSGWFVFIAVGSVSLALAGCSGNENGAAGSAATPAATADATVTVEATPNLVDDDGRSFAISEVGFGDNGYVTLTNVTGVAASLAGLYVCVPPDCFALPDADVKAETKALVAMGDGAGLKNVVASDGGLTLAAESGEVGLYASDDVSSAQDVRAYVEWGSTPHEGTQTAVDAGLWLEGSYVNSSADATRIYRSKSAQWVPE
jgi:hypothetical protein